MITVNIEPEYVASVFGISITNTLVTSVLVSCLLVLGALVFYLTRNKRHNLIATGLRIAVYELLKLADMVTGDRELSKKALPLIATFFLFIVTANLIALLPGFLGSLFVHTQNGELSLLRSPDSDLSTTVVLALISVGAIQFFSIRTLGIKQYLMRFLNFANPIAFILGLFEIISEGVKVLSFSFRLFGNIFAGETLLLIITFLVPYFIPVPFMVLEVFVGVIQAFIFTTLALTFIKIGTIRREDKNSADNENADAPIIKQHSPMSLPLT